MEILPGFLELFGVILSSLLMVLFNHRLKWSSPAPLHFKYSVCCCGGLSLVLILCYIFNFPEFLQHTDMEVMSRKEAGREKCMEYMKMDKFIEAELAVRSNPIGKEKAIEFSKNARLTVGRFVINLGNPLVFRFGALFSILPFIIPLALSCFNIKLFKPSTWSTLIPIINVVTIYTVISFIIFYFIVDSFRINTCTLVSGHWFIFAVSNYAFVIVLVHLILHVWGESVMLWYVGWFGFYEAVVLMVLTRTQMYYHDPPEALAGIIIGMISGWTIILAVGVVELRMIRMRKKEEINARRLEKKQLEKKMKEQYGDNKEELRKLLQEPIDTQAPPSSSARSPPPAPKAPRAPPSAPKSPQAPRAPPSAPKSPPPVPPKAPPQPSRPNEQPKQQNQLSLIDELRNFNRNQLRRNEEKTKKKQEVDTSSIAGMLSVRLEGIRSAVGLGVDDIEDDVGVIDWKE